MFPKFRNLLEHVAYYTTCVNSTEKGLIFRQWLEENDEYDSPNDPGLSVTFSVGSGYDLHSQIISKIIKTIHVHATANVYTVNPINCIKHG